MPKLISAQQEIYDRLTKIIQQDTSYRIRNFLLLGTAGSGKTTLLQQLGQEDEFKYINFSQDCLEEFRQQQNISFRFLTSNDFFNYLEYKFGFSSSMLLIDSLESIILPIYQRGGEKKLVTFMDNFFKQKFKSGLLLSVSNLDVIDFDQIITDTTFSSNNIFRLTDLKELKEKLAETHQLPHFKAKKFANNHYFKAY